MTTTTIAILKDGTPVRIHLFDNPIFDVYGFLVQFTTLETNPQVYRYHQHAEFKREDRKKPDLSGYYNEDLFLKYIQKVEPIPTLDILTKYNFGKILATEEEEITVSTIDFDEPYDYFYNEKKYTFNLQRTLDNKGVRNYLKPIIENFETVDIKINTDGVNGVTIVNNQSATSGGYFYKKNLGDLINTWTISDIQKSNLKKVMSLIVFKIREINKYIIPIIADNTHFFDKEFDVANGIIDHDNFTDLEKLVFNFKKHWGYYHDTPIDGFPRPHKDDFEALFSTSSTYEDYLSYYYSLENFYQICYKTKSLSYYPSDDKIAYLLKILSPSALAVIPYNLIIKCIKQYLKFNLSQEEQRVLVKLVISITPPNTNDFLDFLLEKENGEKTNFQVIYDSLTDSRLERYPFANWFVDEQTNRKYFAFAIYELWKISKYNLDYIRLGITIPNPWPNFKGVDPDNYFNINPQEFNKKNFLTFIPSSDQQIVTSQQRFESSINDKKIDITKIYKQDTYAGALSQHKIGSEYFGSFHLYQQISFCGYESNLDLRIPKSATLPAFLFHFIEEYDRLADFDAGVALAVNLTVDALIIYFTGGTSILKDLQYLKYTTKIGRALAGGIESTEAIEIWQGFRGAADIFTITAGSLTQINHYLITTENNEEKRKILEGCQKIFISLTFLGVGLSLTAQAHAVREAGKVLDLIEALPSGVAHGLAPEMINLLTTLKGNKEVTLTLFGNKLNTLDLGDVTNYIFLKYNSVFTDAQRLKFMTDFQHIDDLAFWRLLNNGRNASGIRDGSYLDNWILLSEKGLEEAKFTMYICNQTRKIALIRYTDESSIKPVIATLNYDKKLFFLDTFGNEEGAYFAGFIQSPKKIIEFSNIDGAKKLILKNNKNFWLINDFESVTITKLQPYLEEAKITAVKRTGSSNNWFTNPDKKIRAEEFLNEGKNWRNGQLVEIPSQNYLKETINANENVYLGIDIAFYNNKGIKISDTVQEIDGLLIDNSDEITKIISMKLNSGKHNFSTDNKKLINVMKNLPDNGIEMKNYIVNNAELNNLPLKIKNHAVEAKIIYTDLRTGKEVKISPSLFKLKIKTSYDAINDFQKIHPEIFNTTKEELIESSYQSIKNKF